MGLFDFLKQAKYTLAGCAGIAVLPAFAQDAQQEKELAKEARRHYITGLELKGETPEKKRERLTHFLNAHAAFEKAEAADGNPNDGDYADPLSSVRQWIAVETQGVHAYTNPDQKSVDALLEEFRKTGQLPEPNAGPKPAPVQDPVRGGKENPVPGWQSWIPGTRFFSPYAGGNALFFVSENISGFMIGADGRVLLGNPAMLGTCPKTTSPEGVDGGSGLAKTGL
jgi:hypothetical protein